MEIPLHTSKMLLPYRLNLSLMLMGCICDDCIWEGIALCLLIVNQMESSFAEKKPAFLMDSKMAISLQYIFEAKKANSFQECNRKTVDLACWATSMLREWSSAQYWWHTSAVWGPTQGFPVQESHQRMKELQNGWDWQEVHLLNLCSSRVPRTMSRHLLKIPHERNSTTSLGNLFQCSTTHTQHRSAFWCSNGASCVLVCAHCLFSWHWAPLNRPWLHLLSILPSGIYLYW